MKISLIHPSRGRAIKALKTSIAWKEKAKKPENIEHILSIDLDDDIESYKKVFDFQKPMEHFKYFLSPGNTVVSATNFAAKEASGNILIYLSDDFDCPENWDQLIIKKYENINEPLLLKVHDDLRSFEAAILTIPIMNRILYEKLGYFWYPEYKSMFVDNDLYWTCFNNNWLQFAPELIFPHNHYITGKAGQDETYKRTARNWNQGKQLFDRRKAENFPLWI